MNKVNLVFYMEEILKKTRLNKKNIGFVRIADERVFAHQSEDRD